MGATEASLVRGSTSNYSEFITRMDLGRGSGYALRMSNFKRVLVLISMTLIANGELVLAASKDLEPQKPTTLARSMTALQKPWARLVRTCRDLLTRALVRVPLQIEITTNDSVMKGSGDISALLGAKYTLDQLTRDFWSETIDVEGRREIHLSSNFPEAITVRIAGVSAPGVKRIHGPEDDAETRALVPAHEKMPALIPSGHVGLEVEIVADPESAGRIERVKNNFKIKVKGDHLHVSQNEAFSFAVSRDRAGVGRFGGIGITRATIDLPEPYPGLLIFRAGELVYGELGWIPTSDLVRRMMKLSFDDKREDLLENYVETLPASRSIEASELAAIVKTMTLSDGEIAAVRIVKARMSARERSRAAAMASDFMTFESDAKRARKILQRN